MSSTPSQPVVRELLRRLAALEPVAVPPGEPGVALFDERSGQTRLCVPVLSVYLDLRSEAERGGGERPAARPGRTILKERLREVERTFWPRGAAYDAVHADAELIEAYLDTRVALSIPGIALFASSPHGLFETLAANEPFQTQVSARAMPELFPLARLLQDQEIAIVALAHTDLARLFVTHRGGLREVRGLADDPKGYHLMHGANAMNQAHYQRHSTAAQSAFAHETAEQIERLVAEHGASEVLLTGETRGVARVRQALSPRIAALVREVPHSVQPDTNEATVWEEVAPLVAAFEAEREQSLVERLVEAVRADALGVVGLVRTRRALQNGQVDILVLAGDTPLAGETRDELIEAAIKTGATVQVVEHSDLLEKVGGVGALLRYRFAEYGQTAPLAPQHSPV